MAAPLIQLNNIHLPHNIFIGNITKVSTSQAEATPLIYLNGGYV